MTQRMNAVAILALACVAAHAAPPIITPGGVVPIYSTATTIQPGEWVSIYGTNLATATTVWDGKFPTTLGGTSVSINGKPAFLWVVSPTQINLQAPDDSATGTVPVTVVTPGGSATSTVTLGGVAPSFCRLDGSHVTGIILRSDGSGTSGGGSYDILGPTGSSLGYKTVAAKAGDSIVLYGVGFGPTNPTVPSGQPYSGAAATVNPVTILIAGQPVTPAFAGISSAGLYQFNLTVPAVGPGDVTVQAMVGGVQTPTGVVLSMQSGGTAPQLKSLAVSPSTLPGGQTVQGTVTLTSPALSGGAIVTLTSFPTGASAPVTFPATVTIPAGSASATFTIDTSSVTSAQVVVLTAAYAGQSQVATVTVTPPVTLPTFSELIASILFQPSGNPSCTLGIIVTPNGNGTYTATNGPDTFTNGTVSGLTFTFDSVSTGLNGFACGGIVLSPLSSGSLTFTLAPNALINAEGSLSGTMSVTGPQIGGGTVTLSGPIKATSYVAF